MNLTHPDFAAVTVAGTNGKGSTVAMLEAMLHAAGYRVGAYSSPHLLRYNERVRVAAAEVADDELCDAFECIESSLSSTSLTYFEFGTLAALHIFKSRAVDIALLEIGLGGRLDAVNIIDADVAIVTSVGVDHTDWLGPDRENIGREKAGIFRQGRPAVCADPTPPVSIEQTARAIGAPLYQYGREFSLQRDEAAWSWRYRERSRGGLPYPAMRGRHQLFNGAAALMALELLSDRFPVVQQHIRQGLLQAVLPGRFQTLPGRPVQVLDVAHNAQAAEVLAESLRQQPVNGRTLAVFAMLKDKAIGDVAAQMRPLVDEWYVAGLPEPRGATSDELVSALTGAGVVARVRACTTVVDAYTMACHDARENDRIVIFGSFYTVSDILRVKR